MLNPAMMMMIKINKHATGRSKIQMSIPDSIYEYKKAPQYCEACQFDIGLF